jgi:hypothetical protein
MTNRKNAWLIATLLTGIGVSISACDSETYHDKLDALGRIQSACLKSATASNHSCLSHATNEAMIDTCLSATLAEDNMCGTTYATAVAQIPCPWEMRRVHIIYDGKSVCIDKDRSLPEGVVEN